MVDVANENMAGSNSGSLRLGVAPQAEVDIPLHEQLRVNRPMRLVAHRAAFPQSRVLEDKRARLFPVARGAGFVQARHRQAPCGFEDVQPMGVMALGATYMTFEQRVMLGQMKLCFRRAVALETGSRIVARVDNEFASATPGCDMQAPRAVAGLAPGLADGARVFKPNSGVGAGGKYPGDVGVALCANAVAHKRRSRNFGRALERQRGGRARVQDQRGCAAQSQQHPRRDEAPRVHEGRFVTPAALSISLTMSPVRLPPIGNTICRCPSASMISVRKL